jgi:hydroxypyruvate reductase
MDQMELSKFITKSMESQTWREKAARIMKAALDSVDPRLAVLQNFTLKNSTLIVNQNEYDLDSYNRVFLVGAGKAGQPMAEAVSEVLGPRLNQGKVIVKEGYRRPSELSKRIDIIEAGHPIPDIRESMVPMKSSNYWRVCKEMIWWFVSSLEVDQH